MQLDVQAVECVVCPIDQRVKPAVWVKASIVKAPTTEQEEL
jgi:hypothetical protein